MTVKELKRRLNRVPDDAIVVFHNSRLYIEGLYEAEHVRKLNDHVVEISSEYNIKLTEEGIENDS